MLITEERDGMHYAYSDTGMMIRQVETGVLYAEAWDVLPCRYTYEETEEPIDPPEEGGDAPDPEEAGAEDYEAALREMGVEL